MNKIKRKRGIALLLVIVYITIFSTIILNFQYRGRVDLLTAAGVRDGIRAIFAAQSAVNLSRLVLHYQSYLDETLKRLNINIQLTKLIPIDKDVTDMLFNGDIANMMGVGVAPEETPSKESEVKKDTEEIVWEGLDDIKFYSSIDDESNKININYAGGLITNNQILYFRLIGLFSDDRYREFFENERADGQRMSPEDYILAIADWVDPDNVQAFFDPIKGFVPGAGSEDSYYQSRRPPYEPKDALFDTLEELRLVRGVDDEFMRLFADKLTVYPTKGMNVNTASFKDVLLLCLACDPSNVALRDVKVLQEFMSRFIERQLLAPFKGDQDFLDFIEPYCGCGKLPFNTKALLGTTSYVYRINGYGLAGDSVVKIRTVVISSGGLQDFLYYRIE